MEILSIIALVALFISHRSLSSRITSLEAKLKGSFENKNIQPVQASQVSQPLPNMYAQTPLYQPQVKQVSSQKAPLPKDESLHTFSNWLKEDWLMKLGAFLFIIGFGWFVSYAFDQGWIGPVGKISLGIVAGMAILILGFWRMMRFPSQGAVFMGLGAGVAILTIFAGRSLYDFFTPTSAIAFDFIITAFVAFASYKFNTKSLAFFAEILAFATPLLVAGQTTDSVFLFSYLFFISLATLVLAGITGWRDLIVASLVFVGMYSLPYITASSYGSNMYHADAPLILNFAYLFTMMYLLAGMFAVVKKGIENTQNELVLAVLNGLFLFFWIYSVAGKSWQSLLFAAWAVVFAVGSFIAFRFSSKPHPFYAYGSVAVAFIGAATATQLDGQALVIAFTIEVLLLVVSVLVLTKDIRATTSTSLLFIVPAFLSLSSMNAYSMSKDLFSQDFFVLIILAISLISVGRIIGRVGAELQKGVENKAGSTAVVFGTIYIWFVLWFFIHILMTGTPDLATMFTLVIYTAFGITAYFSGLYGNDSARRVYGTALLCFVVGRLLLIDVWQMALSGRVITFFAIGILLMATAFLTKKNKQGVQAH